MFGQYFTDSYSVALLHCDHNHTRGAYQSSEKADEVSPINNECHLSNNSLSREHKDTGEKVNKFMLNPLMLMNSYSIVQCNISPAKSCKGAVNSLHISDRRVNFPANSLLGGP